MPFYDSRSLRLHYETVGEGPAVFFLAGIGSDCFSWSPQLGTVVKSGRRAVLVDFAGQGLSDPAPHPTTPADLANDVVALADLLGIERFVVCGLSLGGVISQQLLVAHNERISGAILVATLGVIDDEAARSTFDEWKGLWLAENGPLTRLEAHWPKAATAHYRESSAGVAAYEEARRGAAKAKGASYVAILDGVFGHDAREGLAQVTQPVLVIGGAQDLLAVPDVVVELASYIPNARLEMVERAQHEVNRDRPDVFNQLLLEFFVELEATPRSTSTRPPGETSRSNDAE